MGRELEGFPQKVRASTVPVTAGEITTASPGLRNLVVSSAKLKAMTRAEVERAEGQTAGTKGPVYSTPSMMVKSTLEDNFDVRALLDRGSEVNLMSEKTFRKLHIPVRPC
jgi:hypothetical protein